MNNFCHEVMINAAFSKQKIKRGDYNYIYIELNSSSGCYVVSLA